MNIVRKGTSNSAGSLFVFKFKDKREADAFIAAFRKGITDHFDDSVTFVKDKKLATAFIDKLESRIEDKHADREYAYSALMFDNDMVDFGYYSFMMMYLYQ